MSYEGSHWFRRLLSCPLLAMAVCSAVLVALLYSRVLPAPFVYDDLDQIKTNPYLLSWRSWFEHYVSAAQVFNGSGFRGSGGAAYRPVFWLSLAVDRHLFGLSVVGFHVTSLLLHWLNGVLAFILMRRFSIPGLQAAAAVAIWLALPINSESVAWISGRAYELVMLFALSAVLCAERFLRTGGVLALAAYATAHLCALLSHEAGVLVVAFVGCLLLVRHPAFFGSLRSLAGESTRGRTLAIASSGLTALYYLIRATAVGFSGKQEPLAILPVGSIVWKYIWWMLGPLHMSVERSTETPANVLSAANIVGLLALLALIAGAVFVRRRMPEVSGAVVWTLLALLPFSGIVFLYQGMAERYCYLASLGLALAVVSLAWRAKGKLRTYTLACVALWSGWGSWRLNTRLDDWRDEVNLYASSLKTDPDSPVLLANLGAALGDSGKLGDGLYFATRATRLRPDYAFGYQAQGNIWFQLGGFAQAAQAYEKAVSLQPDDRKSVVNLGSAYVQLGRLDAAEAEFRRAIALAPGDVAGYCDLGVVLANRGKVGEGVQQLLTAIRMAPQNPSPYYFLGYVDEEIGAVDAARQMYQKALELEPAYEDARVALKRLDARH